METKNIVLTKQSGIKEIKQYFKIVLELAKSEEEYPVNLENVWGLVYSEKSKAVRTLKKDFIEGVDYQVLAQNGENLKGGRPTESYYLTTSCLEYFIARKVRAVFEVYRQVFHVSLGKQPESVDSYILGLMDKYRIVDAPNFYIHSLLKAFEDFFTEELKGYSFTELRLEKKIKAARSLFSEDMQKLQKI